MFPPCDPTRKNFTLLRVEFALKRFTGSAKRAKIRVMKKVIEVEGMCCKRCAERIEKKLLLLGAKANFKKGIVFVESDLSDDALSACVTEAGFTVREIRARKGIFG